MNKAIIISGNLAQDHEFIYPYYRLLEAEFEVDVCLLEGKPVKGILGTTLPPNKDQTIKTIDQLKIDEDIAELKELIKNHLKYTKSSVAKKILDNWDKELHNFTKVMPTDYKRVLQEIDQKKLKAS